MTWTERTELTGLLVDQLVLVSILEEDAELDAYLVESDSEENSSSSDADIEMPSAIDDILDALQDLHSQRYIQPRVKINKPMSLLLVTLSDYKISCPEIFWRYLCIWLASFNALLDKLQDDEVFHNNSNNSQFPVAQQLAVALYHFGHFGNAVSLPEVALWAGWGYGTVNRSTHQVIKALCNPHFCWVGVKWPDEDKKEKAKEWVESAARPEWRDGSMQGVLQYV